jgi:hypothetical protein
MRVHEIHCPKCEATLRSQAGIPVGQPVSCPKCKHKFTVEAAEEPDVIDDADVVDDADVEERPARRKGPAPARRRAARDDEEDDEPRPRKKKPAKGIRARDDEDDSDDRPRKKKKGRRRDEEPHSLYWRLRRNVAVRVITLVILLGILAVLAYLLYEKKRAERELENGSRTSPAYAHSRADADSDSTGRPNSGRV